MFKTTEMSDYFRKDHIFIRDDEKKLQYSKQKIIKRDYAFIMILQVNIKMDHPYYYIWTIPL